MDWARHDHRAAPRVIPSAPARLEERWRVHMGPSGRVLSSALYEHPHGVEVRCGYRDEDDLLHSGLEPTLEEARTRAAEWLDTITGKGRCEVLFDRADVCTDGHA
jgi:hypothetical protein